MKIDETRRRLLEENLSDIVRTLKEKYAPDKIIVFGSMASGEVSEFSDLDLLIVKDTKKSFYDRIRDVAKMCQYSVGVDFLVYTPAEVAVEAENNFFFKTEVLGKGKVIYDSAA